MFEVSWFEWFSRLSGTCPCRAGDDVEVLVRAGNDLHADDFADASAGGGPGVGRGLHRGHVAGHKDADQAAAHLVPTEELDVGRLQRRVGRLDQGHETLGLDHPERFHHFCHGFDSPYEFVGWDVRCDCPTFRFWWGSRDSTHPTVYDQKRRYSFNNSTFAA